MPTKPVFTNHHFALTVSDFDQSLNFYEKLGFEVLYKGEKPEKGKKSAILGLNDMKLEVFWYKDASNNPESYATMGNNVQDVGPKHLAIRTNSVEDTKNFLAEQGIPLSSDVGMGDAGYQFFFVRDPDGIWLEFVCEEKST